MRVLFIDIDTLRPDHMGCYGYGRDTTPNLDAVAQEGVRFDNCYCSDAPCLPSRAALISGRFGILNGAVGHGGTAADRRCEGAGRGMRDVNDIENFTNIFRRAGYHTASFSTFAERHSSYWFNAGFNETYNVGKGGIESGEEVISPALDWLEHNAGRDNWYMHLHLWDPHTPYRTPESYQSPFTGQPFDSWITPEIFAEHLAHTGPHSVNEIAMYTDRTNPRFPKHIGAIRQYDRLRDIFDRYDEGVHYADLLLGRVLDKLRAQGHYEDTAIIITADHGENFGELGLYAEHATADYATCRIPLIIKWPGGRRGQADAGFHYLLDLCPTMAELLQVQSSARWSGQSFAGALQGEAAGRQALVLSQMAHVCQRSARFGDYLYIRTAHDGYHLFPPEMLFNIKDDPHEVYNIADSRPDLCACGARIILDFVDAQMALSDTDRDPMWTVMRENGPFHTWNALDDYLVRLEETGRADGAQRLREKYRQPPPGRISPFPGR